MRLGKERSKPSFYNDYARIFMVGELMLADIFSLLVAIILALQIRLLIGDMTSVAYQQIRVERLYDLAYGQLFIVLALTMMTFKSSTTSLLRRCRIYWVQGMG